MQHLLRKAHHLMSHHSLPEYQLPFAGQSARLADLDLLQNIKSYVQM